LQKPRKSAQNGAGLAASGITPTGGRLWKLKFRNAVGAEKKLSLGAYPDVSLTRQCIRFFLSGLLFCFPLTNAISIPRSATHADTRKL